MKLLLILPLICGAYIPHTIPVEPYECAFAGHTGEGFPAVTCTDGTTWYQDLDGTDGSLGTENDGRWVAIDPAYVREERT